LKTAFRSKVIFKNEEEENQVPNITVRNITKHRIARQERKKGS